MLDSPCLQLDDTGTKVRANVKRSVLILREIPESTAVEVCVYVHVFESYCVTI